MRKKLRLLGLIAFLSLCQPVPISLSQEKTAPPPPPEEVPPLKLDSATVVCIDCDKPFSFKGHKQANKNLIKNEYIGQLHKAMYVQDLYHQFQSKAHFDNCDFEGSMGYLGELVKEADKFIEGAQQKQKAGMNQDVEAEVKKAFFCIGQALHAIQDFYAHSNYVELMRENYKEYTGIPRIPVWTVEGHKIVLDWQTKGLLSGYVSWGFPKKCNEGVPTHSDLAKDSATTKEGKIKVKAWENLTQYEVAVYLAQRASYDFIKFAFTRWPLLKDKGGNVMAFDVFQERRGI